MQGLGCAEVTLNPWEAVGLTGGHSIVRTGVGKANAAGAVGACLGRVAQSGHGRSEGERGESGRAESGYACVLSVGLAGALPAANPMGVGEVLLAEHCVLADEGLTTADGFVSQSEFGFPAIEGIGEQIPTDQMLNERLIGLADRVGLCATVSTCSGTDAQARSIAQRTGALAEDMEAAAVGLVAHRLGVPFGCVRVISNTTGNRDAQVWDLDGAFSVLAMLSGSVWNG